MEFYTKKQFQELCPAFGMTRKDYLILLWKQSDTTKTPEEWEMKWNDYKKSEFGIEMNLKHLEMLKHLKETYKWTNLPGLE